MALNLGGVIRLTYAVKNDLGVLVNPGSATLTVTQPDGTTAPGTTVTLPPAVTGQLVKDFAPTQAGLHSVHWATTNPITAEDDVFTVEPAGVLLISVDEAVAHLRASGVITSDSDREQLQWLCLAASDAVERDLGRSFTRRTVTEVYDGDCNAIILRSAPALSVTSVTESGTVLSATDYQLDVTKGLLRRGQYGTDTWASGQYQNVSVTYVTGYANPPRAVRDVALDLVQARWQQSQQASHPLLDESGALPEGTFAGLLSGLPAPLRKAYESLRRRGIA